MHQQLLDQISELKLKGLKEAYLLQMQTPNYIHMPFEERLAHLIDAEIINRKNCRIKQYLRAAKLKYRNAFLEDIEYLANRNLERSQIATLAKNQWIEQQHNIIIEGGKYEKVHNERNEKIAKANIIDIEVILRGKRYKGGLVNSYLDVASDLCSNLISKRGYDIAIAYNIDNKGVVGCSLRSKKDLDSSLLSVMYGGGGHAQASGFSIPFKELNNIIKNKYILVTVRSEFRWLKILLEKFKWLPALFRA